MARQYQFPATLPALDAGAGKDWLFEGLDIFKKRPILLTLASLLFLVLFLIMGAIPFLGVLLAILLTPILSFGILNMVDKIQNDDDDVGFGTLFSGFSDNPERGMKFGVVYFLLCLVSILAIAAIAFIFGLIFGMSGAGGSSGLALLSFFSIYLVAFVVQCALMIVVWMAIPIILHNDEIGIIDAMKLSFQLLLVNWMPILVYNVVALIFIVIASITVIGLFIIFPILICSTHIAYRQMVTV